MEGRWRADGGQMWPGTGRIWPNLPESDRSWTEPRPNQGPRPAVREVIPSGGALPRGRLVTPRPKRPWSAGATRPRA